MTSPLVFFLQTTACYLEALAEVNPFIRCIMTKNGKEALGVLQSEILLLPDYIFLELNMPVMKGMACLAELKKLEVLKNIPVVMYSTSSDKDVVDESIKLGAMDFFVKPSNFTGLKDFLRKFAS